MRARDDWADVGKGLAIVGVVLFHGISLAQETPFASPWAAIGQGLFLFIMPVFFLMSGVYGARRLELQWWQFTQTRIWPIAYLFVAWSLVYGMLYWVTDGTFGASLLDSFRLQSTLWFLFALALYWAIAWVMQRLSVPPIVQVAGSALLALPFAVWFPFSAVGLGHSPHFLVWFLTGCCYGTALLSWKRTASWGWVAGSIAAVVLLVGVTRLVPRSGNYVYAMLAVPAVALVLIAARWISATRWMGSAFSTIGRASLVIYLLHPLVQSAISVVINRFGHASSALAAGLPVIDVVIAVPLGLFVARHMSGAPLLFKAPRLGRVRY
ncbi:acyltransferase family protein [uncultured Microbacterium sp.]|uniref:acyltransferase family protein n=1 Tax=uncultured Microbacterium sp. TaxID=191216 RepID=UPI0025E3A4EB|nr:acyltransferase family protein [uncultured Microbacterium sp.]